MSSITKFWFGLGSLFTGATTTVVLSDWSGWSSGGGGGSAVPELDPSMAVSAIALLAAVALVAYGAHKRA